MLAVFRTGALFTGVCVSVGFVSSAVASDDFSDSVSVDVVVVGAIGVAASTGSLLAVVSSACRVEGISLGVTCGVLGITLVCGGVETTSEFFF